MMQLVLHRLNDNGLRTRGHIVLPDGTNLHTLEEPWKNNQTGVSCVPPGTYPVVPHGWEANAGTKFKKVWRLEKTAPRVAILIHAGNTVDDIEGCILLGLGTGILAGKDAVVRSKDAVDLFRKIIGQSPFTLTITPVG